MERRMREVCLVMLMVGGSGWECRMTILNVVGKHLGEATLGLAGIGGQASTAEHTL
jgi:hypothetical protein